MAGAVNPWVPNQHGAWAMLLLPVLVGAVVAFASNPIGISHAVLLMSIGAAWIVGYFAFFAAGVWLRARREPLKTQSRRAFITYAAVAGASALAALLIAPAVWWWGLAFAPLVLLATWETVAGRPRSLLSGLSTTIASALLLPVMLSAAAAVRPWELGADVWISTAFVALYFAGTVFYVKSVIRERRNARFYKESVIVHVLFALVMALLIAVYHQAHFGLIVLAAAAGRAWAIPPAAQQAPKAWTPKRIGMLEIPLSIALAVSVTVALL